MYPLIINTKHYSISLLKEKLSEINSDQKFDLIKFRKKIRKIFAAPPCFELKAPWVC